jgi:serine phosphatase RsbU (regulator of sigma subunit)
MNKQLKSLWEKENAGIKDGMDTAVVCIDIETKTMEYAGAKSHLFIIQSGIGNYIRADKFSIDGDLKNRYTKQVVDISKPTKFYLYSDGFQDQFGGEVNQKFMSRRFREFLEEIHAETMEVQNEKVETKFLEWKGNYNQIDDVLVIGVELPTA